MNDDRNANEYSDEELVSRCSADNDWAATELGLRINNLRRDAGAMIDANHEAELLASETFDKLCPDNERDSWFMVRITKIMEALHDRPVPPAPEPAEGKQ